MMMRTNCGLVYPRDHRRAERRTDRRRRIGITENNTFPRELIDMRCLNQFFSLVTKVARHVVYQDPDNVRLPLPLCACIPRWLIRQNGKHHSQCEQQQKQKTFYWSALHVYFFLV